MSLALTCDCGARFEVDDLQAGKDVPCPECREAVRAPQRAAGPQLSFWALASVVLALVGAFTLVGSVAAVLAGLYALLAINHARGRLTGSGVALGAIVAGLLFTGLTLLVVLRPGLLPVGSWLRQRSMAGQVDTTGTLEMLSRSGDVLITRPSSEWGRARNDRTDDPVVSDIQQKRELLLVNLARHAYVDVFRDTSNTVTLERYYDAFIEQDINPYRAALLGEDEGPTYTRRGFGAGPPVADTRGPFAPQILSQNNIDEVDGHQAREWVIEQRRGGQTWMFIIRAYKRGGLLPIHVVRAYTPLRRFEANEEELRRLLDSVRIPQ